jgi:hypothetical protein
MPTQEEHDRPENLVEPAHLPVKPASSLEEAANSINPLEGYVAVNGLNNDEIAKEVKAQEEELKHERKGSK